MLFQNVFTLSNFNYVYHVIDTFCELRHNNFKCYDFVLLVSVSVYENAIIIITYLPIYNIHILF